MKGISVTLDGEEAVFYWKDGKVYCEGYDLENEKVVLALTGLGEGVGVLLVAMNECCKSEAEFMREVGMFVVGQKVILDLTYWEWPEGQLLFEYYSYSSDSYLRWEGLKSARLSERHYKRLLAEKEMKFKITLAELKQLPEKYFHALANLSSLEINLGLAYNKSCPERLLELLAQDQNASIRRNVACNGTVSQLLLELLAEDKDAWVRRGVAQNQNCPESLLEELAQDEAITVSRAARESLSRSKGMEV